MAPAGPFLKVATPDLAFINKFGFTNSVQWHAPWPSDWWNTGLYSELLRLLCCYAAYGSLIATFPDYLSVPYSKPLNMGLIVPKLRYKTTVLRAEACDLVGLYNCDVSVMSGFLYQKQIWVLTTSPLRSLVFISNISYCIVSLIFYTPPLPALPGMYCLMCAVQMDPPYIVKKSKFNASVRTFFQINISFVREEQI
jgi:hypothetical protein